MNIDCGGGDDDEDTVKAVGTREKRPSRGDINRTGIPT